MLWGWVAVIPKPPACDGCPFKSRGKWFVPDGMVEGAEVLLLSQNPGADEEAGRRLTGYDGTQRVYESCSPAPLTGMTGYDLGRKYLPLAGLERGRSVSLANPIRCRLDNSNELPPVTDKMLRQAVEHCQHHHFKMPESTKLVVAEGAYALYAATGEDGTDSPGYKISRGIEGWRGWVLPWNPPPRPKRVWTDVYTSQGLVVLPTFHLSFLYRSPWYTPVSQRDWSKVQQVLSGKWPERFPEIRSQSPEAWPRKVAFDTEYTPQDQLIRYSLAYRSSGGEPWLWVVERDIHLPPLSVPPVMTTIFHNVEADVDHLNRLLGHHTIQLKVEDTMHLHAVLWADLDHDLDFLGSIYARTNRWKHLVRTNPRVYAGGDALGTWDSFIPMAQELERDPQVKKVYYDYQLPLTGIIHKARAHGLRVVPERVERALESMGRSQLDATLAGQAHVGWPLNLGSASQVSHELYNVEKVHLNEISGRVRRA